MDLARQRKTFSNGKRGLGIVSNDEEVK